jgi:hypothetical protein
MMVPGAARRGGMPLYKNVGNRILTFIENRLLDADPLGVPLGYRAYRVSALAELPFQYNTNDFHFDTEIIIQLLARKMKIVEVPIPTYYGDEICHVEGIPYAFNCVATVLRARANRYHLVYHPKFDVFGTDEYVFKEAPNSVHQHVVRSGGRRGRKVLELGAGHGGSGCAPRCGARVVAVDLLRSRTRTSPTRTSPAISTRRSPTTCSRPRRARGRRGGPRRHRAPERPERASRRSVAS